ncbi:MAG: corrinoid protein [Clostridia bacterium]|nr:corrinoid protein [Clostridia bacterium]
MLLEEIASTLQTGNCRKVKELVNQAIEEKIPVRDILEKGLIAGMDVIGEKFKKNEIFIPEVLIAARAMNQALEIVKPLLKESGVKEKGRACIGTVQGDLHDIGKNLVKIMLESKGFEVIDLGTDVSPETFVKAAIENDCSIIGCSALLTTTRPVMQDVVKAVEAAGLKDKVKVMIGGAAVSDDFREQIGADRYTTDAATAADAALAYIA